jgi:hypothetical protein
MNITSILKTNPLAGGYLRTLTMCDVIFTDRNSGNEMKANIEEITTEDKGNYGIILWDDIIFEVEHSVLLDVNKAINEFIEWAEEEGYKNKVKEQLKEFKDFQKKIDLKTNEKDIYESIAIKTKDCEFVFEEI